MTFLENDIRPKDLDKLRFEAQQKDIDWLVGRKAYFVASDCPACGAKKRARLCEKLGFEWDRCLECGTAYMNPRPPDDLLGEFYKCSALYDVWNAFIFPASRETRRARIFQPRLKRTIDLCDRLKIKRSTLVEIGAAHGIFCQEAQLSGQFDEVIAIEPSSAQAETCRELGIKTIDLPIEDVAALEISASVAAAFEVIEHISNPLNFMTSIATMLQDNGAIVLSTPNVEGFDIATLGKLSDQIYPEHITLFSPNGLTKLATRSGLHVLELTTPGVLDCDIVRNKALEDRFDLSDQPFLRRVLLDEWDTLGQPFQEFLRTHRLSSHMWLVAQKQSKHEQSNKDT